MKAALEAFFETKIHNTIITFVCDDYSINN